MRQSVSICIACAAFVFLMGRPAFAASKSAEPVEFTLSDQNARVHVVRYPRGKVSFLVLSDRAGASQIEGWIAPVYARYDQRVEIAGIADLPNIPSMFHALFRREFKKRLTYPVMLDGSGDVAKAFGYQKGQAQVFVIGTSGEIALKQSGPAYAAGLADVYRAIDQLQSRR